MTAGFVAICVLLGLVAVACVAPALWRDRNRPASTAALTAACLLIPALAVLLYTQSSNYQWAHAGLDAGTAGSPPSVEDLIGPLRERLEAAPDDPRGWMLLGASYTQVGRYPEAVQAFDRVLDLSGGRDSDALMGKAEALILGDPERLLQDARRNGRAGAGRGPVASQGALVRRPAGQRNGRRNHRGAALAGDARRPGPRRKCGPSSSANWNGWGCACKGVGTWLRQEASNCACVWVQRPRRRRARFCSSSPAFRVRRGRPWQPSGSMAPVFRSMSG